ncbi:YfcC family protein [Clostridiisalibacter paucivorans]|uniref:YfcC family protein n=1 Tax=Clostridiisalibacter paucivorans TaxID=408753 RepID=UPI000478B1AB|nr:YfcC family protein [Clostridiisalibacter paucivorans]
MNSRIKVPHTLTLLLGIIIVMSVLTWIVPSGEFDYAKDAKKPTPIAGTYKQVDKVIESDGVIVQDTRQGIKGILTAPFNGSVAAVDVVMFVLLLGGSFGIIGKTGSIEAGVSKVVKMLAGKELLVIPVAMLLFALGGTIMGMAEETIPFYMIFIPLMMSMGYDSLTGAMIIYLGAQTGVTASTSNPFSVGIAQASAGIPISSGIEFRWIQFFIYITISILFVMWYAKRVKSNPKLSPMYEIDKKNKEHFLNSESEAIIDFKWYHGIILLGFIFGIGFMAYGVKELGWYIEEISMIFLSISLFAGIIGMIAGIMTEKDMATAFVDGCKDICFAAIVIGIARGILVVAQDGKIIDTILNSLANTLNGLPKVAFTTLNLLVQTGINFLVPSSSAQAALTMPLMAPLGDLVKVDRQVIVTAYQYGCGLGHFIFPTQGVLMAALGISKIPFQKWLKVVLPLVLVLWLVAAVFLFVGLKLYPVV